MKIFKKNKPLLLIAISIVIISIFFIIKNKTVENDSIKIGVLLFTEHKVIDEIFLGFKEEIEKIAKVKKVKFELIVKNANADQIQLNAIKNYFENNKEITSVFVVGTPAAKFLKNSEFDKPVIFGGVPDPVAAGLIDNINQPDKNFSGTKYFPPVKEIIETFINNYELKNNQIAILRNPAEPNSVAVSNEFISVAKEKNIKIIDFPVIDGNELESSLRVMSKSEIDGVFIPTDNLVYSRLNNVVQELSSKSIPVFSCTELSVEKGADFSLGTDYYNVGKETAKYGADVFFEIMNISELKVLTIEEGFIYINKNKKIEIDKPIKNFQIKFI